MWFNNMKSRVKGDFQARFRENVEVRFLDVTRLDKLLKSKQVYLYLISNGKVFMMTGRTKTTN